MVEKMAKRHGCVCLLPSETKNTREAVVLVHGLIRTSLSMLSPGIFLRGKGYTVLLYGYRSTRNDIATHAREFRKFLDKLLEDDFTKIHFVTHSLGGVISRIALAKLADPKIGRLVMIGPPNQGSKTANRASKIFLVSRIIKPLNELRNEKGSFVKRVPVPDMEIGVIAGDMDAKVTVEESHLPGEKDHLVVKSFHTYIMNRRDVKAAILNFILTGKFKG